VRIRQPLSVLSAGCLAAILLGGCSSGPAARGVTPGPAASGSVRAGASATAAGSAGSGSSGGATTGGAAGAAAQASGRKPNPCDTTAFAAHASLASGAVHEYVTKPYSTGRLSGAGVVATAARATSYAQHQLSLSIAGLRDCPTAKALVSVTGQNVTFLGLLSSRLQAHQTPADLLAATDPLIADVAAQAGRLKVTLAPKVPTTAELG
jgi:hypothetical protein